VRLFSPRMSLIRQPAAPPSLEIEPGLPPRISSGRESVAAVRIVGGHARELFDWVDERAVDRPALRRAAAAVRTALRIVSTPFGSEHEPSEIRQARALGPAARPGTPTSKVLVMTLRAWTTHVAYELLLGHELQRRGADCRFVVCGGGLPVCELGNARREFPHPCAACKRYVTEMLGAADLDYVTLDELVDEGERLALSEGVRSASDPHAVEVDGIRLAPHVVRSLLWVARTAWAARELDDRREFREFLESAAIVTRAFGRLLDRERPDSIVMVSGLFFAESAMRELASQRGIPVVMYDFPGRPGTVFVSEKTPASFYEIDDLWAARGQDEPSTAERERVLDAIGARRSSDGTLWSAFRFDDAAPDARTDVGRRIAVFTNVSWDTAVTLRDIGFRDIYEWLEVVVTWALDHDDVTVDIRVHPGEMRVRGFESDDSLADYIRTRFPDLPDRITVYGPESSVDSYALIESADTVLVYTSTIGLEAVVLGRPTIVAADVHYRGKDFTIDVDGPDELRAALDAYGDHVLTETQSERAIAYANLFFFESMVELRSLTERYRGKPVLRISDPASLASDPGVARVCDAALGRGDAA